jgi:16S rRNA (guanine527-N7)-methyltransferase
MISLKKHWHHACGERYYDEPKVQAFIALFLKWNKAINLSAARTESDLESHVADCFHLVGQCPMIGSCLDVGAGGGLPGVLIAIGCPEVEVVSIEPIHKKHAFLRTAKRELGLSNFHPHAERLEVHARSNYNVVVSRATWDISQWLQLGRKHALPGGIVLGMEAAVETELDTETVRVRYEFGEKKRAILRLTKASSG